MPALARRAEWDQPHARDRSDRRTGRARWAAGGQCLLVAEGLKIMREKSGNVAILELLLIMAVVTIPAVVLMLLGPDHGQRCMSALPWVCGR